MLAFSAIYSLEGVEFWKIFLLDPVTHTLELVPVLQGRECTYPCWSPDRQSVVFTARERAMNRTSDIYVFDLATKSLRLLAYSERDLHALTWSPDRQSILVFDNTKNDQSLMVCDAVSGNLRSLMDATDVFWPTVSPAWQQVVFVSGTDDAHIYIKDFGGTDQRLLVPDPLPFAGDLAWSPNGKYLAFTTYEDDCIYLNTIDMHSLERKRFGEVAYEVMYAWSPTSTYIAYLGYDEQGFALYVVDISDATTRYLSRVHAGDESGAIRPTNPAWSADGEQIAFSTFDTSLVFQIYCVPRTGGELKPLLPTTPTFDLLYDVAWW